MKNISNLSLLSLTFLLNTSNIKTESNNVDTPSPQEHIKHEHEEQTSSDSYCVVEESHHHHENELSPGEHLESLSDHFFIILEHPESIQNVAHHMTHIFSSLMHLALNVLQDKSEIHDLNNDIAKKHISEVITSKIKKYKKQSNKNVKAGFLNLGQEDDKEAQVVLANFAQIVNHFFNLVQDPENEENVKQNALNIAGNVMNIAAHAMRTGQLPANATEKDIQKYVADLDENMKVQMAAILIKRAALI